MSQRCADCNTVVEYGPEPRCPQCRRAYFEAAEHPKTEKAQRADKPEAPKPPSQPVSPARTPAAGTVVHETPPDPPPARPDARRKG